MHRKIVTYTLAGLLLLTLFAQLLVAAPRSASAITSEESRFLTLVNRHRASKGLPALKLSPKLTRASRWLSADMGQKSYFSHTDSLGRDPFERLADFGYAYSTYRGENIAAGYGSADDVLRQWLNSYDHRRNIESSNFRAIGIARVYVAGSPYGYYWTTAFGGIADTTTSEALSNYTDRSGSYYIYPSGRQVNISGTVTGNYAGRSVSVRVQKRVWDSTRGAYVWKTAATYSRQLDSSSRYSLGLQPARGRYRVQTYFPGRDWIKSSRSVYRYYQVK